MEHKPTELGHFGWSLFQFGLFRICLKLHVIGRVCMESLLASRNIYILMNRTGKI